VVCAFSTNAKKRQFSCNSSYSASTGKLSRWNLCTYESTQGVHVVVVRTYRTQVSSQESAARPLEVCVPPGTYIPRTSNSLLSYHHRSR
jgi:hypothetical protein